MPFCFFFFFYCFFFFFVFCFFFVFNETLFATLDWWKNGRVHVRNVNERVNNEGPVVQNFLMKMLTNMSLKFLSRNVANTLLFFAAKM